MSRVLIKLVFLIDYIKILVVALFFALTLMEMYLSTKVILALRSMMRSLSQSQC
jgi:hypothetical protein